MSFFKFLFSHKYKPLIVCMEFIANFNIISARQGG